MTGERWRSERGVALMLVLWIVIVLSAIASGVVVAVRRQTALVGAVRSRTVARYAAESGVVAATAALRDLFAAAEGPEDEARVYTRLEETLRQWGERPLGADARFQVAVADLGARIDLNGANEDMLLGLFAQFVGEDEAAALVDALEDWKDDDDEPREQGAEADDYAAAGSPFVPANGPLLRLDDLTRIRGFGDSLARALAPYVTVSGEGIVNVNTAPEPVLAAVPELGPEGAQFLVQAQRRGEVFASGMAAGQRLRQAGVGRPMRRTGLATVPSRVLIVSRGWLVGAPLTHEIQAVVQIGDVSDPEGPSFRVMSWTERDR